MADSNGNVNGGSSFPATLFLVFLVLKLTNVITWSWWWVTAPLWMPAVLSVIIVVIILMVTRPWRRNSRWVRTGTASWKKTW